MVAKYDSTTTNDSARLPGWWRFLLIASSTVLFCSCRGQALTSSAAVNSGAMLAAIVAAQVTAGDGVVEVTDEGENADARPGQAAPVRPRSSAAAADDGTTFEKLRATTIVDDTPSAIAITPQGVAIDTSSMPPCVCSACMVGGTCLGNPCNPWIIGASDEYLCDGGDYGLPAGVKSDWTIVGLEQEDAIAHYDTIDGRVIVTPSNRVCIYAPRFAAVRRVVNPIVHERGQFIEVVLDEETPTPTREAQPVAWSLQRHAPLVNLGERPPSLFRGRQQAGGLENLQATMDVFTSLAAYADLQLVRAGIVDNGEKARLAISIESAVTWTGDQAAQVVLDNRMAVGAVGTQQAGAVYHTDGPDNPRLRLVKLASRAHALPGEDVEFTLRYDNIGDQVIGNVTIVDNLATRLEYVPQTAESTVDANFITAPNSGGSTILRWEIIDPVEPGEGGVLRFRAKVR